jgi:hypothetical protein
MSIASIIGLRISDLFEYMVASLLIRVKIALQNIGKEEDPQNGEHDEKFDQDDPP